MKTTHIFSAQKDPITVDQNAAPMAKTFVPTEILAKALFYILKIPNLVFSIGALSAALRLNPNTFLLSAGSITPGEELKEM